VPVINIAPIDEDKTTKGASRKQSILSKNTMGPETVNQTNLLSTVKEPNVITKFYR